MRDIIPVGFTCYPTSRGRRGYTTSDHAFSHLIGAIYLANVTGVRRLKVERVREGEDATEFSAEMFEMPNPTDMQAAMHLFCHLTHIELNLALRDLNQEHRVTAPRQHKPCQLGLYLANLAKLLASAKDLQQLILGVTFSEELRNLYGPYMLVMKYLFPSGDLEPTWGKLNLLSLDNVYSNSRCCIEFIERHRATLRSVTFSRCHLTMGLWADVVDAVIHESDVKALVLDCVDEPFVNRPATEVNAWKYEGHLVLDDGERNFVRTCCQH